MNVKEVNAAIHNNAANFLWVLTASCTRQRTLTKWRHNDENVMVNFWTHIILKIETTAFRVPSVWICKENIVWFPAQNVKKWTLGNALASRLKMKKFKNDWGQLRTNERPVKTPSLMPDDSCYVWPYLLWNGPWSSNAAVNCNPHPPNLGE